MALMLGVVGATAAGLLFTAAAAQAVTGTGPGQLALNPASGATTLTPTWSTTTACPAGFQTSAELFELNTDGSIGSIISPTLANLTAPFSGTLLGPVGKLISLATNVKNGGTSKWVVGCFAGRAGTGNRTYVQSDNVTISADGKTYTSSTPSFSGTTSSAQSAPWGLIVLVVVILVGGGVGGWLAWRWRRGRRDAALLAAAAQAREVIEQRMPGKPANPAAKRQGQG